MSNNLTDPLEQLSPEQRERLKQLKSEIQTEKITVGFSIEDRDQQGRKKWAQCSMTASRGSESAGFSMEEARIAHCLLSKQVVEAVYGDAIRRGVLQLTPAVDEEIKSISRAYDTRIVRLMKG